MKNMIYRILKIMLFTLMEAFIQRREASISKHKLNLINIIMLHYEKTIRVTICIYTDF